MIENRGKISILGCGWLGFPLAKKLIEQGYEIKGSTTSENKGGELKVNQIEPFLIKITENEIIGNIKAFLENSEILIVDIPPNLRNSSSENFVKKIKLLISEVEKSSIRKVVFVSSTSVFADEFPIIIVNERSTPNPETESGKQLVEVEKILVENKSFQSTIVRFGGLIGNDRHPIHFLAGKKNIQNPDSPVNLIHQEDCIKVIFKILKQAQYNNIVINAVYPFHPTRKEYYTQKAKELNLEIPEFIEGEISKGKIVKSEILENNFGFNFSKPI